MNCCLNFLYKVSTEKKLFSRFRQRYDKKQLKLLDKILKSRLKMHRNVLKVRFLNLCISNRVVPSFIEHKVRKSKLKCSPSVEKLFIQDEINRLKSLNNNFAFPFNAICVFKLGRSSSINTDSRL